MRVHGQRYSMGTMVGIVAWHGSRAEAARAIEAALDEIVRLDRVMSHFRADSDLARLLRDGRRRFTTVGPDLYEVLERSIAVSTRTDGRFDVTVPPLLALWSRARAEGRAPAPAEIEAARRCVGFEKIEMDPPDRVRLGSDCVEIDLGGIGKGYAVDRALDVLAKAGVRHAVVNAGSSSIGAIGAPPGADGWPARLGAGDEGPVLVLENTSMSTSQQTIPLPASDGPSGIVDARTGAPAVSPLALTVVGGDAAAADALSTTLTMMTIDEGKELLRPFPGVSAYWVSAGGRIAASYGEAAHRLAAAH